MDLSRRLCWVGLVFALVIAGPAAAQPATGTLDGRILKGAEGVGGVTVLVNETKSVVFTEEDGTFAFENVRPGSYTLILTLGDNLETRTGIEVTAGEKTDITIDVDWEVVYESVRVTAAARRAEKIVDAPSAVTSVPEEEIEREASHGQLPKVLEFTPGAEVTQSGVYDFNFNTRGFNSSLNRRVATYVDGRDVGAPLLGAQEWAALSIPLDDLQGLEFVRGPSAALYGANASAGVINMTTKAPRESLGGFLRLTAGELGTLNIDFRQAASLGNDWFFKVTAGARNSGDFTLSRDPELIGEVDRPVPEYADFCRFTGDPDCLLEEKPLFREDNNHIRFGTVRVDKYFGERLLTMEASATEVRGPVFQTGVGRVQVMDTTRPFARVNFSTPRWTVLGSYARRDGHQRNLARPLREGTFDLFSDTIRMAAEAQYNNTFGPDDRGRIVVGGAYTYEDIDSADGADRTKQTILRRPIDSHREAVFAQLDWKVNPWLKLVGAGRVDRNTLHSTQFSPKVAAVFSMTPMQTIRATFNKAFQVANYSEFFLNANLSAYDGFKGTALLWCNNPQAFPQPLRITALFTNEVLNPNAPNCLRSENPPLIKAVGNDDLDIEQTTAWEVGYSGIIAKRMFITLDYYNNENENFISDLLPQVFTEVRGGPRLNPDFPEWIGTDAAENTFIFFGGVNRPVADLIRSAIVQIFEPVGFQFSNDPDTDETILVARTYENIGRVDTQGLDFGLNWFANDHWNIRASYSWFDFEIVDSGALDVSDLDPEDAQIVLEENLLPNTPESKASMSVAYVRDNWEAAISSRWVDDFRWNAGLYQGNVPAYWLVDVSASWDVTDRFKLGLNASNVLDQEHFQAFGGDLLTRRVLAYTQVSW